MTERSGKVELEHILDLKNNGKGEESRPIGIVKAEKLSGKTQDGRKVRQRKDQNN